MSRSLKIFFFLADLFVGAVVLVAGGYLIYNVMGLMTSDLPDAKTFFYLFPQTFADLGVALMAVVMVVLNAAQLWSAWWLFRRAMSSIYLFFFASWAAAVISGEDYLFWFYGVCATVALIPWYMGYIQFKRQQTQSPDQE